MKTTKQLLLGAAAYLAMALYAGVAAAAGLNVVSDPVIFGGLTSAATEDNPVCFDQASGQLGQCSGSGGIYPANIIWVAQSGGDYTDLRDALADITDASSGNRYLIRVAPGVYELGSTPLLLKSFVDIEGSGTHLTILRGSVGATGGWTNAFLVKGIDDTVLKNLTLKNECAHEFCAAMFNYQAEPTTYNVKFVVTNTVSGGVSVGVHNDYQASPTIIESVFDVTSVGGTQGIYSYKNCTVNLLRSKIEVAGTGIVNHDSSAYIAHSRINATSVTVENLNGGTSEIFASSLAGGPVAGNNADLPSCAGVTDESNTFYTDTCPL